jgi:hypothetical protein
MHRTGQKYLGSDHHKKTKAKTNQGGRTAPCFEFPKGKGCDESSQDKGWYLRPEILRRGSLVQPERTGDIPDETGHRQPPVQGVTQLVSKAASVPVAAPAMINLPLVASNFLRIASGLIIPIVLLQCRNSLKLSCFSYEPS